MRNHAPRTPLALATLAGLSLAVALTSPVSALAQGAVSDGILVTMSQPAADEVSLLADATSALDAAGLEVEGIVSSSQGELTVEAQPAAGQTDDQALAAAQEIPGVDHAQLNYVYELILPAEDTAAGATSAAGTATTLATTLREAIAANDPYAQISSPYDSPNQYWLYSSNLVGAWELAKTNNAVTIVTLDSGARLDHPDLADNILAGYAWDSANEQPLSVTLAETGSSDHVGHGTLVAGVAAAVTNNGVGVAGASYNANVLPIKVLPDNSSTTGSAELIRAYEYVLDLVRTGELTNVRVFNLSLGSYSEAVNDDDLHDLIREARDLGILTVCAGGNGDYTEPNTDSEGNYHENIYPGDFEECVSVTALEKDGTNIHWSDFNDAKDISAPGRSIWSTASTGSGYSGSSSGTSLATPIVSGTAALLFAADPDATVDEVLEAMYETAIPVVDPDDDRTQTSGSHGSLDAGAALEHLLKADEPETPTFSDVYETDWYYGVVGTAAANGIMNGDGMGTFAPERQLTRAEAACVLYNLSGQKLEKTAKNWDKETGWKVGFTDVANDQFYTEPIIWCKENGVINGGGNGIFLPNSPVTRQEFACMLANYALVIEGDTSVTSPVGVEETLAAFPDSASVTDWARANVAWVAGKKIMGNNGWLSPTAAMDRATCAAMLVNYAFGA